MAINDDVDVDDDDDDDDEADEDDKDDDEEEEAAEEVGPLIYLLYVNDIMDCDIASDLNMFADDTAVVAHGKVLADVVSQVNHDMTKLTGWFNTNKLYLST